MPILRLAYVSEFLLALIAIFELWSQTGGQGHLDLLPWWIKLVLGTGAAFACVRATASAVGSKDAWNRRTLRWCALLLLIAAGCGAVTWYAHVYYESDEENDQEQEDVNVTPTDWRADAFGHGLIKRGPSGVYSLNIAGGENRL